MQLLILRLHACKNLCIYQVLSLSACLPIKQSQSCSQISKSSRKHRRKSSYMDPSASSYEDFKPPHRLVREPLTHTLSVDLANQGTHLSLSSLLLRNG
jgi:hypothetical protein